MLITIDVVTMITQHIKTKPIKGDQQHSGSEEYAMLIKKDYQFDSVEMVHYEDKNCVFIRRPYGLKLSKNGEIYHILVFHSNPNNEKELVELSNVFTQFGNEKTIMMGDLNTGCHYVSFSELSHYPIGQNYSWILDENMYTNVEKTCPYDRIVSTNDMKSLIRNHSVLNEHDEAKRIGSDHYPISVEVCM
jgi:hypothetical protein